MSDHREGFQPISGDDAQPVVEDEGHSDRSTELFEETTAFFSDIQASSRDLESALDGTPGLNDRLVKTYLDEVLLMLIAARDGACGQDLIQDLYRLGCGLSPGTIYPHLHDLAGDGILEMHEQRRTKQFEITDHHAVRELVQDACEDIETLSAVFMLCESEEDARENEQNPEADP